MAISWNKKDKAGGDGILKGECLSTDTKPTNVQVLSQLVEIDTGDKYEYRGSTAGWVNTDSSGGIITEPRTLAHERNAGGADPYGAFVPEWDYTAWAFGDGDTIITSNPAILGAVIITGALTGDAAIRDGTTAGGTLIYTVSTADKDFYGIKLDNGIFVDDNASAGTIIIAWRDQ